MKRITFLGLFVVIPALSSFAQQVSSSLTATNWGRPVAGVQLSISLITNVIELGSTATIRTCIRNASTNTVFIFHSGRLPLDFGVFLTDDAGKKFDLTPKPERHPVTADFGSLQLDIAPSTGRESEARVTFGKGLPLGNYHLELARDIQTPGFQNTNPVVSNPLPLRLIQAK